MSTATLTRQERKSRKVRRAREREIERRNLTPEEKQARRREHAEEIRHALERLETSEGMARFLETRQLNPHLTPLACALVADQLPGCVAGPLRYWANAGYRVKRGESARAHITASGFWPLPVFAAEQTDYPPEYVDMAEDDLDRPSPGFLEAIVASLREAFEAGRKTPILNGWVEANGI